MRIILILLIMFCSTLASAASVEEYLDGPSGVSIQWYPDGSFKSLVSVAESTIESGAVQDIQEAIQKATLRAKAQISLFMNERITTEQLVDGLSTTVPGSDALSKRAAAGRQIARIRSQSQSLLRGVIVVATHVKHHDRKVQVIVATSQDHINAAKTIKTLMQ